MTTTAAKSADPDLPRPSFRWRIIVVLMLSAVSRWLVVFQGGQFFLGDEARYHRGIEVYQLLRAGDGTGAAAILAQPEHAAFTWLGALLAAPQHLLAQATAHGDWSIPGNTYASAPLAAALLSLFGVLNLWLVYRLALTLGSRPGAGWALLLAACSNTLFYYSRHLLPYDVAMAAWLGALLLGMHGSPRAWLLSGLLAGLCFHLYNGFWFLLPATLVWQLLLAARAGHRRSMLTAWIGGGLAGLLLPAGLGTLTGGSAYWATFRAFSGTVTQGLFAEGWSLPVEYAWHAEGGIGVGVVLAIAAALIRFRPWPRLVTATLGTIALMYLLLVLASSGLHRFVVYGRTVHPFIPLGCLLGGWALARGFAGAPTVVRTGTIILLAGAAAFSAAGHFTRVFPREVEQRVLADLGNPKHWLTFSGPIYRPLFLPVTQPTLALVNAQMLYPIRTYRGEPQGETVFSFPHPLTYPPYQYEGHTPRERRVLREHPPAIALVRLTQPDEVPAHPPADQIFSAADRPDGRDGGRD